MSEPKWSRKIKVDKRIKSVFKLMLRKWTHCRALSYGCSSCYCQSSSQGKHFFVRPLTLFLPPSSRRAGNLNDWTSWLNYSVCLSSLGFVQGLKCWGRPEPKEIWSGLHNLAWGSAFIRIYECEVLPCNNIRKTYFNPEWGRKGIFVLTLIFWVAEKEFDASDYMTVCP